MLGAIATTRPVVVATRRWADGNGLSVSLPHRIGDAIAVVAGTHGEVGCEAGLADEEFPAITTAVASITR